MDRARRGSAQTLGGPSVPIMQKIYTVLQVVAGVVAAEFVVSAVVIWTGVPVSAAIHTRNAGFALAGMFAIPCLAFWLVAKLGTAKALVFHTLSRRANLALVRVFCRMDGGRPLLLSLRADRYARRRVTRQAGKEVYLSGVRAFCSVGIFLRNARSVRVRWSPGFAAWRRYEGWQRSASLVRPAAQRACTRRRSWNLEAPRVMRCR